MADIDIKVRQSSDNRIKIVSIKNVLTVKELPGEYTEHVPYMYWTDLSAPQYLFINWVGGLDHVYVGDVYTEDEFRRINNHIDICKRKLHEVLHGADEAIERAAAYIAGLIVGREDVDNPDHPVYKHLKEEYKQSYRRRAKRVIELATRR